jgi:hypothetical protein
MASQREAATDDLETLRLAYTELCRERDRLRNARASFSKQLGPLPVAAGISTGTIAVFARHVRHPEFLWVALGLLVVLVCVGVLYGGMPAYRQIRATKQKKWRKDLEARHRVEAARAQETNRQIEDLLSPGDWYRAMIALERDIYGEFDSERNKVLPPIRNVKSLQDALDRERTGFYVVQLLFAAVIVMLALSELLG